jgi:hypothetical protein
MSHKITFHIQEKNKWIVIEKFVFQWSQDLFSSFSDLLCDNFTLTVRKVQTHNH